MKLIKVIMRPEKTYELKDILTGIGYHGITARPCSGFGESKKVIKQVYRGKSYLYVQDSTGLNVIAGIKKETPCTQIINTHHVPVG